MPIAMNIFHKCPEYYSVTAEPGKNTPRHFGYGKALEAEIFYNETDKAWEAGNGEYATPVRFCPFCGVDLWGIADPRK